MSQVDANSTRSKIKSKNFLGKKIRSSLSILLILSLFFFINIEQTFDILKTIEFEHFLIALVLNTLANIFCAIRWGLLLNLKSKRSSKSAISAYFEGIAFSTVVPGGLITGDIYRTIRMSYILQKDQEKIDEPLKTKIGLSVVLDRVHGLWALSFLSVISATVVFLMMLFGSSIFDLGSVTLEIFLIYFFLLIILTITLMSIETVLKILKKSYSWSWLRQPFFLKQAKAKLTILTSLSSQLCFSISFYICLHSCGIEVPILLCFAISTGVFLFASIPLNIGGFGPREYGFLLFFTMLGYGSDQSVASSILFGVTATVQGLVFIIINLILSYKARYS